MNELSSPALPSGLLSDESEDELPVRPLVHTHPSSFDAWKTALEACLMPKLNWLRAGLDVLFLQHRRLYQHLHAIRTQMNAELHEMRNQIRQLQRRVEGLEATHGYTAV